MPDADFPCLVIGAKSGHIRNNKSWVLGRLLRDLEKHTDDQLTNNEHAHEAETRQSTARARSAPHAWEALRVCVFSFQEDEEANHGSPRIDWLWYMGISVVILQLSISSLPWILYGRWGTFFVTFGGTSLSIFSASLPQWRQEKWACPRTSTTVTITRGNGCRLAMVVLGVRNVGLDLEVLATGTRTEQSSRLTNLLAPIFAIMWIVLLICVAGMNDHSWCKANNNIEESLTDRTPDLLGIGTIGMLQNVFAAGATRRPEALGIQIKLTDVVKGPKVQGVLKTLEERYPLVGTSLLSVFFPGSMRVKQEEVPFWRDAMNKRMAPNEYGFRIDALPPEGTLADPILQSQNTLVADEKQLQ